MDRFWVDSVDRLTFAFQPIVRCADGSLLGVEALLRGYREASFPSIQDVFDLASRDQRLVEVEMALREKSIRLFSLLPLPEETKLFSNLDNRVFIQTDWRSWNHRALLERTGLSPSRFVLEISERHRFFPEVDEGQLEYALDDFGTGYSGLMTLAAVRPRYLKIDRAFVTGLGTDPGKEAFFEGMVSLGRRIGAITIAEGVETKEELDYCLNSGCDAVQGFAVGRPAFNGEKLHGLEWGGQGQLFPAPRVAIMGDTD